MEKASRILLLVGFIIQTIFLFLFLLLGILFIYLGSPAFKEAIIEGLQNGSIHTSFTGTVEQQAAAIQLMFVTTSIWMFIYAALNAAGAIITLIAQRKKTKGLFLAAAIVALIDGSVVATVGGIFGMIVLGRQSKQPVETIDLDN